MGSQPWPFGGYVTSSITWPFDSRWSTFYKWSMVAMRLFSTVMEIWWFEVLPGRLFQEQRLVVNRSAILHWSHIPLFATLKHSTWGVIKKITHTHTSYLTMEKSKPGLDAISDIWWQGIWLGLCYSPKTCMRWHCIAQWHNADMKSSINSRQ